MQQRKEKKMRELKNTEMDMVAGGQGIRELIEQAFPGGEWLNGSYYPNGLPSGPPLGPVTTT